MADQLTDQQIHDLYERVFRDTLVNGVFETDDPNDPCVVGAVAEIRRVLAAPSIEAAAREIKHYDSPEDAATALIDEARRVYGWSPEDAACGQEQTIDQLKAHCHNESLLATAYRKARDRIAELERDARMWFDGERWVELNSSEEVKRRRENAGQQIAVLERQNNHWKRIAKSSFDIAYAAQQQVKSLEEQLSDAKEVANSVGERFFIAYNREKDLREALSREPTDADVEAVEGETSYGRGAWDMEDPKVIIAAAWRRAAALAQQDTPHRPIREVLDAMYRNGGDAWDGVALCEHGRHPEWCDTCVAEQNGGDDAK